jgi:mannose-6-phosphate isomerase-like protein (cupin superfamily)
MHLSASEDDVIEAPKSGKRVAFQERPDDVDSDPLRFEMWLESDGHGPMRHVHPKQDETLEVLDGRMGVFVDGDRHDLGSGERLTIPAGVEHRFWNVGDTELHLRGSVSPGLRTEAFMRITYGLPRDGAPATSSGMPLNALRLAVLIEEYDDMLYLGWLSVGVQRAGIKALARLGRSLGYDNHYPEYLG